MKIVTGYTGAPHISSNDDQGRNQGAFGSGSCVLNVGNKFAATMTDATTVTIQDGEGSLQGVHFRVEPGTTDTVSIDAGTAGYNRVDLICARYTKDALTGVENISWVAIKGTPGSTPDAPTYNTGSVLGGATIVDFPVWAVLLTGTSPALYRYASIVPNALDNLWRRVTSHNLSEPLAANTSVPIENTTATRDLEVSVTVSVSSISSSAFFIYVQTGSDVREISAMSSGQTSIIKTYHLIVPANKSLKIALMASSAITVSWSIDMYKRTALISV